MHTGVYWLRNIGLQIKIKDLALFLFVNRRLECRLLDRVMLFFTALGSLPFAAAMAGGLLLMQSTPLYRLGLNLAGALITAQLLVQAVKRLVNRPRPYEVAEEAHPKNPPACRYSFPSGHTCAAFCIALAVAHSLPGLAIPVLGVAGLVGISRVYLGVHYPSDVLFGGLAAGLAHWLSPLLWCW